MTPWTPVALAVCSALLLAALLAAGRASRRARPAGLSVRSPAPAVASRRAFLSWLGGTGLLAVLAGPAYFGRVSRPAVAPALTPGALEPAPPDPVDAAAYSPPIEPVAPATAEPVPSSAEAPGAEPDPTPTPQAPVAQPPTPPRRPNVLLITIDTVRADRIGAYGFAQAQTPTIDALAAEGARFARAIVQLPQTNASHAALFTGLYPSTNGVKVHMVDKLTPNAQTLAKVFADGGYRTAGIYSWVSLDPQFCGLDQGFQTYQGCVVNRTGVFANQQLEGLAAVYRQLKAQVPVVKTVDAVLGQSDKYEQTMDGRADVTTASVLAWLDAYSASDPFFLWVHYYDPHYPYSPPPPYDHVFGLQYGGQIDGSVDTVHKLQAGQLQPTDSNLARLGELYQGEIAFTDAQIARVLDALRQRGLADDTIVVVTSDHGESFGEHGDWTHGARLWKSETHVPLVVRYPSRIPAGTVVEAPAQLIDVMPTLLDLAGLQAPQPVQGTSLLPLITGTDAGGGRYAFTELADEAFVSLETSDWVIMRNNANGELQLYDLHADADEQSNLAQSQQALAADLNARLGDLMKLSGVSK